MKLIKINTDHYVVVDDSEIKEGDYYFSKISDNVFRRSKDGHWIENYDKKMYQKITYSTQPLNKSLFFTDRVWGCERLSLGEVKELIGEVDVVKKAEEIYLKYDNNQYLYGDSLDMQLSYKAGVVDGYNQALEDNKEKKYTEEDVISILEKSRETGLTAEYLMLTLQPKTEWEVEIIDGKLKLL